VSKGSGPLVDYVKSDAETDYRELNLSDELIDIFKKIRRFVKLVVLNNIMFFCGSYEIDRFLMW